MSAAQMKPILTELDDAVEHLEGALAALRDARRAVAELTDEGGES
ncbi:hypothetical protein CLV30_1387 [Haloactinopolyspora alba]|uniref:Uncharacterized protein n=1 Tax=Haloactinopolyspora alba TaxID=648780 RepID=A0A2P8D034_9ACTN|nr:hypothetical protein [Haloactinopolyspora alba]PSK90582.1 hypothetical protein CLV30_1387 [Haloactinopolyspora alba]